MIALSRAAQVAPPVLSTFARKTRGIAVALRDVMTTLSSFSTRASLLMLFATLGACGGIADLGDGGSTPDSGNPDGGPGPGPSPDCPTSPPTQSSSCSKNGIQCEYGNDVRFTCNQIVACTNGSWDYAFNGDPSCPTPQNPSACPATFEQVQQGASCTPMGTSCNYSNSTATRFCECNFMGGPIQIDGGPGATWECGFGTATGCPSVRPRIGTKCSQTDLNCSYDVCGAPSGLSFQCSSQTMTWVQGFGDVCAGAN